MSEETKSMTFTDLEEYIDLVTTNTQNLMQQLGASERGILAERQNKQGIMGMTMSAGNALIMERLMEYLREKRSNILVTNHVPKPPALVKG